MKILVEKYLEKDRKLFAAFMDQKKAYDRVWVTNKEVFGKVEDVWTKFLQ